MKKTKTSGNIKELSVKTDSSALSKITFNPETNEMTVRFRNGATYTYPDTELLDVLELFGIGTKAILKALGAKSVGKQFNLFLKKRKPRAVKKS